MNIRANVLIAAGVTLVTLGVVCGPYVLTIFTGLCNIAAGVVMSRGS